mmetsp:Transcript_10777/g.24062  ORF Transcript_10777/g.24062 Transcript_10777/m.24062 type:complete len:265 (-) Transcript_10777:68-862(-)|eukprot:CAMPEP_0168748318 /NCGR_PEP_ID=MMETSP0724-20121128/16113_1 /TAXON_ID=265536 /ORGANISM="Amphiprora sp., Strain CCMP467" /LENGTH=264 /DNA_ID=CAMNT_0008796141 /DNA_START=25 /DNA_END=819 /DNA_ORIENTATION=+
MTTDTANPRRSRRIVHGDRALVASLSGDDFNSYMKYTNPDQEKKKRATTKIAAKQQHIQEMLKSGNKDEAPLSPSGGKAAVERRSSNATEATDHDMTDFSSSHFNSEAFTEMKPSSKQQEQQQEEEKEGTESTVEQEQEEAEEEANTTEPAASKMQRDCTSLLMEDDNEDTQHLAEMRNARHKPRNKSTTDHVHQDEHESLMQFAQECQQMAVKPPYYEEEARTDYSKKSLKDLPLAERQAARKKRLEEAKARIAAKKAAEEQQ